MDGFFIGFAAGLGAGFGAVGAVMRGWMQGRKRRQDWQWSDLYQYGEAVANLRAAEQRLAEVENGPVGKAVTPRHRTAPQLLAIIAEQKRLKKMFAEAIVGRTR